MTEMPDAPPAQVSHTHLLIECLTVSKLRVASVRLQLEGDEVTCALIHEDLAVVEQALETAGALAQALMRNGSASL